MHFQKVIFVENTTKPEIVDSVEFIKSLDKLTPEIIDIQAEVMKYGYMFDTESLCTLINIIYIRLDKYNVGPFLTYLGMTWHLTASIQTNISM